MNRISEESFRRTSSKTSFWGKEVAKRGNFSGYTPTAVGAKSMYVFT